ncbi:MAG TPA: hypothetical protein VMT76_07990 [Puia sp.]|nr:hypothetical protein [Puia sp.]
MKKNILLLLFLLLHFTAAQSQDSPEALKKIKLNFKTEIRTDTGVIHGYFWKSDDSSIYISKKKKFLGMQDASNYYVVPSETISFINIKRKRFPLAEIAGGAILGFVVTAGLWENEDVNADGHLSFWELLWGAVDGVSAQGKARRRTAIWVGVGGAALGFIIGLSSGPRLIISLPTDHKKYRYILHKKTVEILMP